jgi:hypothetical protein
MLFFQIQASANKGLDIAPIAIFDYQVIVSECFDQAKSLNYVRRVKFLEYSLLIFEVLYHPLAHLASSKLFACVDLSIEDVAALVDCGICTLTNFFQKNVILDLS